VEVQPKGANAAARDEGINVATAKRGLLYR